MKTKVFQSGNSKAVRIPASIKVTGPEMEIIDLGKKGILIKEVEETADPWDLFEQGLAELGGSWPERVQDTDQKRSEW